MGNFPSRGSPEAFKYKKSNILTLSLVALELEGNILLLKKTPHTLDTGLGIIELGLTWKPLP